MFSVVFLVHEYHNHNNEAILLDSQLLLIYFFIIHFLLQMTIFYDIVKMELNHQPL